MISILYDPGKFPALLEEKQRQKRIYRRNGGIPQEGDLQEHLNQYIFHVDELIPNKDFDGLAVIDFESWRPIFRQNFGLLQPYKDISYQDERDNHPFWSKDRIEREVLNFTRNFNPKFELIINL